MLQIFEVSDSLGYDPASLSHWLTTVRDTNMLSVKVEHQLLSGSSQRQKRTETAVKDQTFSCCKYLFGQCNIIRFENMVG